MLSRFLTAVSLGGFLALNFANAGAASSTSKSQEASFLCRTQQAVGTVGLYVHVQTRPDTSVAVFGEFWQSGQEVVATFPVARSSGTPLAYSTPQGDFKLAFCESCTRAGEPRRATLHVRVNGYIVPGEDVLCTGVRAATQ